MDCPNCKKELIVVEREKIELDYCLNCKGFWFDNNEWDLLCKKLYLGTENKIGDIYSIPKLVVKEKAKKCPICNSKLEKFMIYDTVLDRCPKRHGIWFDANEASKVLSFHSTSKNSPIDFIGETFYR